ncbi:uncharacterized protein LOC132316403 [Cornus florida]|uniref:uncharacterized protein LOC132316403 n=1 Tax=Cornus florida TaxID=4283 RepID=UPI00289E22CB|nr:uncharacterized protein LOC132316403 [Cornus florida]
MGNFLVFSRGKRGVRQGDPISPMLFVLAMEVLSLSLGNAVSNNPSFKFHWRCSKLSITHLAFADDLLLFSFGNHISVNVFHNALTRFLQWSGHVFFSGVDNQTKAAILYLLQFNTSVLPITYLGLPLISSAISATDCQSLVQKITARICFWTSKFLSYAGRVVLIKSIIHSIQTYWSQIFILPLKVIEQVNQILRKFYWSRVELRKSGAKVAWAAIYRPKYNGGLGFDCIDLANRVAGLKHI